MEWLLPWWTQNLLMDLIRDFWKHFPLSPALAVIFSNAVSQSTNVLVYYDYVL